MSTISDILKASELPVQTAKKPANEAQALNDRFLRLLVAQMSNQDPLNPLDNAQVTSQMAQINTVTGINGLSDAVERLLAQFAHLEGMQAAQLTGRDVLVKSSALTLTADAPAHGGFMLEAPAERVKVEIANGAGEVVRTITLDEQPEGLNGFEWDGLTDWGSKAPAGRYEAVVTAHAAGKDTSVDVLMWRRVQAVRQDSAGAQLVLSDGSVLPYSEVKQIL